MDRTALRKALWQMIATAVALAIVLPAAVFRFADQGHRKSTVIREAPPASSGLQPPLETENKAPQPFTNRLIHENSPYLLQHAHNPVNWLPWGKEALEQARRENKPVFLSVGYSTCYWCHVMERESFEDEEVAAVLNQQFVCIKVDREERPDVDEQYMLATQILGGRGGWPNSVWLMPDGRPWMAGTYFPRERFLTVLNKIAELWRNQPELVEQQATFFASEIKQLAGDQDAEDEPSLDRGLVERSIASLKTSFDPLHGGFGGAPKFPPHGDLRLAIREAKQSDDPEPRRIVEATLDAIWRGGIHDHLGGGFHRYSTDERWLLPHFEKMLYDNAQLLRNCADAYVLTGNESYRAAVADIERWLHREMIHPKGGFYSAIDAESEGEEGKSYVWTHDELTAALGSADAQLFAEVYGCRPQGNFSDPAGRAQPGTNVLHLPITIEQFARDRSLDKTELSTRLATMRDKLLAIRQRRPAPLRDDKILAGWNALMIGALAHAGKELNEPKYTHTAERAADFLMGEMFTDGKLFRSWREGQAHVPAYLDDYAYLAEALLELYEATGKERWLTKADEVAASMVERFHDPESGGFFFTSHEHETLIVRSKNLLGGGNMPSPNAVAAVVLLRLGKTRQREDYVRLAEQTLESVAGLMQRIPGGTEDFVLATAELLDMRAAAPGDTSSQADARFAKRPVSAEAYASRLQAHPGDTIQIAVKIRIDDGWHLYGPNPGKDFIVPLSLKLQDNQRFMAGEVERPLGIVRQDAVLKESLQTYEGENWFRLPIQVREQASLGMTSLALELRYQACDQQRCLEPRTAVLEIPVEVADDAGDSLRHPEIFPYERDAR